MYFYHAVTDTVHHILGENRIYRPQPQATDNNYRYRCWWSYFNLRLSCQHDCPVPAFLSLLSNPGCPILDVQSWFPVLTVLDRLSCSQLSYSDWSLFAVLSLLSFPLCRAVLSSLSFPSCPVATVLSLLPYISALCWLPWMSPVFVVSPGLPVRVILNSRAVTAVILSWLSYPSCPATIVLY
jgi:hypothetical protein